MQANKEDIERALIDTLNKEHKNIKKLIQSDKKYFEIYRMISNISDYEEVIDVVHAFLTEVQNQLGVAKGEMLKQVISDTLTDTLEEHGWLDDDDLSHEIHSEIYKNQK